MVRRPESLGSLAQYVLVTRIAAAALTFVVLAGRPRWQPPLLLAFALLVGMNYLALRHWDTVLLGLKVSTKPYYLVLDAALATALLIVVGIGTPLVLYLVGTVLLAGLLYRAVLTLTTDLVLTLAYGAVLAAHAGFIPGDLDVHTVVTLPALLATAGVAGLAIKRLLLRQDRAAREIAVLGELAAARQERLRVARDLHDTVTKNLHGVWLLSRGVDSALDRGDLVTARSCAVAVGTTAKDLAEQSRAVIRGLRDDGEVPFAQGLADAVRQAVAGHPVAVEVEVDAVGTAVNGARAEVRQEVQAITLEAVHNALKHAAAERISVALEAGGGQLVVVVADDGRGFPADGPTGPAQIPGHFGLVGMRERAGRIGGHLTVHSRPGTGTRVELRAPIALHPNATRASVGTTSRRVGGRHAVRLGAVPDQGGTG
jgi:signal transduction histidine kinase